MQKTLVWLCQYIKNEEIDNYLQKFGLSWQYWIDEAYTKITGSKLFIFKAKSCWNSCTIKKFK